MELSTLEFTGLLFCSVVGDGPGVVFSFYWGFELRRASRFSVFKFGSFSGFFMFFSRFLIFRRG